MRKLIFGTSILLFALSGLIIFRAIEIPVTQNSYQNAPKPIASQAPTPEPELLSIKSEHTQAAERAPMKELPAPASTMSKQTQAVERAPTKEPQAPAATSAGNLQDKSNDTVPEIKADTTDNKNIDVAVLGNGVFGTGHAVNEDNLLKVASTIEPEILAHPDYQVIIEGHTSNILVRPSTGERYRNNMELSLFRAKSVASVLAKNSISAERIIVVAYGDTRPIASNETFSGRSKNRRVEVRLVPPAKARRLLKIYAKEQAANEALVITHTGAGMYESDKNVRVLAVLDKGVFDTGKVVNEDHLMFAVNEILPDILAHPDHRVIIEGHTSSVRVKSPDGARYLDNTELSLFRARAVAGVLEQRGVPTDRIFVTGYGDTRPISSNHTLEGRIINRRVEIKLIPEDKES